MRLQHLNNVFFEKKNQNYMAILSSVFTNKATSRNPKKSLKMFNNCAREVSKNPESLWTSFMGVALSGSLWIFFEKFHSNLAKLFDQDKQIKFPHSFSLIERYITKLSSRQIQKYHVIWNYKTYNNIYYNQTTDLNYCSYFMQMSLYFSKQILNSYWC